MDILYKCSGKLVGERTRKPDKLKLSELLFADDAAAVGNSRRSMKDAVTVGLISTQHTKDQAVGHWHLPQ